MFVSLNSKLIGHFQWAILSSVGLLGWVSVAHRGVAKSCFGVSQNKCQWYWCGHSVVAHQCGKMGWLLGEFPEGDAHSDSGPWMLDADLEVHQWQNSQLKCSSMWGVVTMAMAPGMLSLLCWLQQGHARTARFTKPAWLSSGPLGLPAVQGLGLLYLGSC